jgi:hypothetical protein
MDDFGNLLHWTDTVKGWHCLGLYSYATGITNMGVLYQGIDFYGID